MTRSSRVLLTVTLIGLALWLHVTHCSWRFPNDVSRTDAVPVLATDRTVLINMRGYAERVNIGYGLFAQPGRSGSEASVWGVAVPVGMLVACLLLWLGRRRANRIAAGRCPDCGHMLTPASERCQECGSPAFRAEGPRRDGVEDRQ